MPDQDIKNINSVRNKKKPQENELKEIFERIKSKRKEKEDRKEKDKEKEIKTNEKKDYENRNMGKNDLEKNETEKETETEIERAKVAFLKMFFERPGSSKKIPTDSEKKRKLRRKRMTENSISNKNQKEITFFLWERKRKESR